MAAVCLLGRAQSRCNRAQRTAWFGAAPQQVAADRATVEAMGESLRVEGRLADVAVRAVLGTSAAVHVVDPASGTGLREGLGALLRFPTA